MARGRAKGNTDLVPPGERPVTPARALVIIKGLKARFPALTDPTGVVPNSMVVAYLKLELANADEVDIRSRNFEIIQRRREGWTLDRLRQHFGLSFSQICFITRELTNEKNAAKVEVLQYAAENPNESPEDLARRYKMPLKKIRRILAGASKIVLRPDRK